jgi:hypothetical protein
MSPLKQIKDALLKAPDTQLDAGMFPLIERWDDEPTTLQVLEVLDNCVYAGLASGFVIVLLENLLDMALTRENTTKEEVVKLATWRESIK